MAFMVKKVALAAKRIAEGKVVGRCQCISFMGSDSASWGFQCAATANYERDGRLVCHSHIKSPEVTYVDTYKPDPYAQYKSLLAIAAGADPDFRRALREFAA